MSEIGLPMTNTISSANGYPDPESFPVATFSIVSEKACSYAQCRMSQFASDTHPSVHHSTSLTSILWTGFVIITRSFAVLRGGS